MAISLQELTNLVDEKSVEELMMDDRVMEFVREMDDSATKILKESLGSNENETNLMISLIQAVVCVQLLERGDLNMVMFLLSHNNIFGLIVTISMKMGVGLAAMEEWR